MVACMRMLLLWSYRAERSNGRPAAVRPGVTVGEEVLEPRRLQQQEPTRWLHHSRSASAPALTRARSFPISTDGVRLGVAHRPSAEAAEAEVPLRLTHRA